MPCFRATLQPDQYNISEKQLTLMKDNRIGLIGNDGMCLCKRMFFTTAQLQSVCYCRMLQSFVESRVAIKITISRSTGAKIVCACANNPHEQKEFLAEI